MNDNEIMWYQKKVKGSLAEAVCRSHFEAMGYFVETYGIEHKTPYYTSLRYKDGVGASAYWNKFPKDFTKQPDLLISRVNEKGERDAILVEVKYRNSLNKAQLKKELIDGYKSLNSLPILFYVVVRTPIPHVQLLFNENSNNFFDADDTNLLRFPIYKACNTGTLDLVDAYNKIVLPSLRELIG